MRLRLILTAFVAMSSIGLAMAHGPWYDHSLDAGFTYNGGNADIDGGSGDLGVNFGLQVAQLVEAMSGYITTVRGDYLQLSDHNTQAFVDVYSADGSTLVASSGLINVSKSYFTDDKFRQYLGVTYEADVFLSGFNTGSSYLVSMQIVGPSWAYLCRDLNGMPETFARDFSHFGYPGGYGTTDWTSLGLHTETARQTWRSRTSWFRNRQA